MRNLYLKLNWKVLPTIPVGSAGWEPGSWPDEAMNGKMFISDSCGALRSSFKRRHSREKLELHGDGGGGGQRLYQGVAVFFCVQRLKECCSEEMIHTHIFLHSRVACVSSQLLPWRRAQATRFVRDSRHHLCALKPRTPWCGPRCLEGA